MTQTERPIVCQDCREAMPDINWNHPCPHAKIADPTKKSKFIVLDGGMFRRYETLYDALQCVNEHGGDIYEPLASDAARQVGTIEEQERKIKRLETLLNAAVKTTQRLEGEVSERESTARQLYNLWPAEYFGTLTGIIDDHSWLEDEPEEREGEG